MSLELLKRLTQGFRPAPESMRARMWSTPMLLDRGDLGEARLAVDHRGRRIALWENHGTLWTLPVGAAAAPALRRAPFGEGTTPRLAVNPEGRGLAVWLADLGEERQILGKALGTCESPEQVVFRTPGWVRKLQIAVDRRGNALVVWLHEKVGRIEVMAHSFDTRGEAWEKGPTILGLASDPVASPQLAANHSEHAMVLWEARDSLFDGLLASHHWPTDRIWSDRPVPVVAHAARHHQVAMDDHGNAVVLWVHAPYGQRSTLEACFFDVVAGEWREPTTLAMAQEISLPRLVMNGSGEALAAWCQRESGGGSHLLVRAFQDGGWEPGAECLDRSRGRSHDYAIALGADGRAGALLVQHGKDGDQVVLRARLETWSKPKVMAECREGTCASPRIALFPHGMSLLWMQGTGPEKALMAVSSH
ncbi:hypothetical protein [Geothrix terrae]|uniref:hypothetical protein n=1 Tax=Geothrix terrae TaxID=2922720 RepID=UPI001FAE06FE|nr:hypothetical protein [Geothrix terrae]